MCFLYTRELFAAQLQFAKLEKQILIITIVSTPVVFAYMYVWDYPVMP